MTDLPGLWSLSPIGALLGGIILFYWMLASGKIITRSSHERELAQANKRGDEWKETALESRQANQALRDQNTTLIESQRITADFFSKISPQSIEDTRNPHVGP